MSIVAAVTVLALGQTASINDVIQRDFQDAVFTARKRVGNQRELAKINKDFGQSYRFDYTNVRLKEPMKLRLDSKVEDTNVTFILNGTTQLVKLPGISNKSNLAKSPGRRQTPLDFGLLTPSMFNDLFQAKFVRVDRATGELVFDLTYLAKFDDTTRHRIWVDKDKKYTTKREWYNQPGRQIATFTYENPKLQDGLWFPTRLTVRNMENKVAGVTEYENLKINGGIPDSLFAIN